MGILVDIDRFLSRNGEGYPDPTCYQALRRAMKETYGYRPLAYICSPYSGNTDTNVGLARRLCARAVTAGRIPIAPHLLFPQFMDDSDVAARDLAMFFNHVIMGFCKEVWVYTPRISAGMRQEITWAKALNKPIHYVNADFKEVEL